MWNRFYPRIALIIISAVLSGALIPIAFALNWWIYACTLVAAVMVANAIWRRRFSLSEVGIFMALIAVDCRLLQSHYVDVYERVVVARNRDLATLASMILFCEGQVQKPLASQMSSRPGTPHSWRTWVLSKMGCDDLLNGYDIRQSWSSPTNASAAASAPKLLRHPQAGGPSNETSVVFVIGAPRDYPNTIDPGSIPKRIIALDIAHSGIPWTEPRDITAEEILAIVKVRGLGSLSPNPDGSVVGICSDGSLIGLSRDTTAEELRRYLLPPP
jgi:hypothetical protein